MTNFLHMYARIFTFAVGTMLFACQSGESTDEIDRPDVVEIIATGMTFSAPDTIPSGWVTLRLINDSEMVHFGILERMPPGKGLREQQDEIAPVFQNIMDNINGKPLSVPDAGFDIPEWFGEIIFISGAGFISPGKTAETTVLLEPGTYLLECYVKTAGVFHSYNPAVDFDGMVHEFTVTEEPSGGIAPQPTIHVSISSENGIQVAEDIESGKHTIAVHFTDQKVYPNFLGHDVHLAQISDSTDIGKLVDWIDWVKPMGLETPAPAAFLGGTHEMPAGNTGYFHVELSPGEYAFIAEVPGPDTLNMFHRFSVESGEAR